MATEVLIEEADLDEGIVMIFKEIGHRVRMAFDPRRITESAALRLLCQHLPNLLGAMSITHRAAA